MKSIATFYRLLNVLSIDVVLGAVCCAAWFAVLLEVNLRPYALITLGLTVWIIYTADHLLDARRVSTAASTERHRFHQQHFALLLSVLSLAVVINLFLVFFIRETVFQWGMVLSAIMVIYFMIQKYLKYVKELVIALLFSCGVLLPAMSIHQQMPDALMVLLISQFLITALLNLLLFSWFDEHNDYRDRRKSFATTTSERKTKIILWALFIFNGLLMCATIIYSLQAFEEVFIIVFMNLVLLSIFIWDNHFRMNERFRLAGDSIFLFPLFYLFL